MKVHLIGKKFFNIAGASLFKVMEAMEVMESGVELFLRRSILYFEENN